MYAKLQNGMLRSAPKTVTWNGCTVNNPSAEKLMELGYKPVVYTDMPEPDYSKSLEISEPDYEKELLNNRKKIIDEMEEIS